MHRTRKIIVGAAALGAALGGAGIANAVGGIGDDDGEGHVTGPEADAATAAALELTGGGTANAVERDNEAGATWEVEVTKPDGTTVDVRLDEAYELVVIDDDNESPDDDTSG
ncbi:MAG: hypothetical protein ACOYXM_15275 [Actinomycetota bacterium]